MGDVAAIFVLVRSPPQADVRAWKQRQLELRSCGDSALNSGAASVDRRRGGAGRLANEFGALSPKFCPPSALYS